MTIQVADFNTYHSERENGPRENAVRVDESINLNMEGVLMLLI